MRPSRPTPGEPPWVVLPFLGTSRIWCPALRLGRLSEVTTTLITGGNRGLGLETARQLVRAGHDVLLGARDLARAAEAATALGCRPIQLDVTCDASVAAAASLVRHEVGHLDVLVNNAGVFGAPRPASETTAADLHALYDTNVYGVVRMMSAFLPLLTLSDGPVVVNVSSGLGSLTVAANPSSFPDEVPVWVPAVGYASAKAALNMITVQYAHACPDMRINAVDPGYTDSDPDNMPRPGAHTVAHGAQVIATMAELSSDGPTGTFIGHAGNLPW